MRPERFLTCWQVRLALPIVLAFLCPASPVSARGAGPPFVIGSMECERLDAEELTRILVLELSSVENVDELPPLAIEISCDDDNVVVAVTDREKTQKIERTVPAPGNIDSGRERQIALTIAQFAGALWRLRVEEASTPPELDRPPEPPLVKPTESAVEISREQPAQTKPVKAAIEIGGGMRARSLGSKSPLLSGYGEIFVAFQMGERLALVAALGGEGSRVDRKGGEVGAFALTAGLGISGLLVNRCHFLFDARLLLMGGYARFEGRATDSLAYDEGVSAGGVGEVRAELVPTILFGSVSLGLCLGGGYGLKVVVARIRDDEDVTFGGWWAGAGLRLGFGFSR